MEPASAEVEAKYKEWFRSSDTIEYAPRPVLRIWGHADNLEKAEASRRMEDEEPFVFNIQFDSHDYTELPNGAQKKGEPNVYLAPVTQDVAAQHTRVRLDRYSDSKSYLSFRQQIEPWFVGDGRDIVLVHLFDRGGKRGTTETQGLSLFLPKTIPHKILVKAVQNYLRHGPQSNAAHAPQEQEQDSADPSSPTASRERAIAVTDIIIRGRLRRRNRRHGVKLSESEPAQVSSPSISIDQVILRGRLKRRSNRDKFYNRKEGHGSKESHQLPQVAVPIRTRATISQFNTNLASRLPENLKRLPRILLLGRLRNDFSDSIVIPLFAPYNDKELLGSLVITRPFLLSMQSEQYFRTQRPDEPDWMYALCSGPPLIKATTFTTQGFTDVPQNDRAYWDKFPLRYVEV